MAGLQTKATMSFSDWWKTLNDVLARQGEAEVLFGDAHGYYETGHCVATAAYDVQVVREIQKTRSA